MAGAMGDNERRRNIRLSLELTQEELMAIDDFRFGTRCPSRSAAVRALLKIGMASRQPTGSDQERKRRPVPN
jgi:hypothetical protein